MNARDQKIEKLAIAMGVTVSDVNSFIGVLSYELKNGAANLEEAIQISTRKMKAMLGGAHAASNHPDMNKVVSDWFYGVSA